MSKKGKSGKTEREKESYKNVTRVKDKKGKIKDTMQNDNLIKSVDIIDDQWQCTVVMFVIESQRLYDTLLLKLFELPNNFTTVTEQTIGKSADKKGGTKKSRGSSKTSKRSLKSTLKSNKKLEKSKSTKLNKEDKNSPGNTKSHKENIFEGMDCAKTCLLLKRFIVNLKDCDIKYSDANDLNKEKSKLKKNPKDSKILNSKNAYIDGVFTDFEKKPQEKDVVSHRYILLWGFYNLHMLEELAKLMIPVRAIIHVREPTVSTKTTFKTEPNITSKTKKKAKENKTNKASQDKLCINYNIFLNEMQKQITSISFLEENKHVLFLNYTTMSCDKLYDKGNNNFSINILKMLHGIKEAWDKYKKFCGTIQIQEIPNMDESFNLEDANLYNTLMLMIPLECTSIPVILHCILEQVLWWDDTRGLINTSCDSETSSKSNKLFFAKSESLLPKLVTRNLTPIIVNEMDDIKMNTFHLDLPEFNFEQITTSMLTTSPVYRLWQRYPPHQFSKSKWYEFQLQKLKSCHENDYSNLSKLYKIHLHQFLMNTIVLNSCRLLDKNYDTKPNTLYSVESDTLVVSSIKESVFDETRNTFVREIIYSLLYKVPELSIYSQQETKYINITESVSIKNIEPDHSKYFLKSNWFETNRLQNLPVDTLLQKKQEYKQEKLKKLKSFLLSSEFINLYEEVVNLEHHGILIDGMVDYDYIEEYNPNIMCQQLQKSFQQFLNTNYEYFDPTDCILLWFNNMYGNDIISSQNIQSILETPLGFRDFYKYKLKAKMNWLEIIPQSDEVDSLEQNDSLENELKPNKEFDSNTYDEVDEINTAIVYNLGSLRMEVSEYLTHFVSPDGSRVTITKRNHFDKITSHFSVTVMKNNTTMIYEMDPAQIKKCIDIYFTFDNDIKISCSFKWDLPKLVPSEVVDFDNIDRPILESLKDREFKLDCSLTVSVPSGLLIEIIPTDTILGPFYIRQRYLDKGPTCSKIWEELYRCYLNNGTVVIFRSDNFVDVLYSNGTVIRCSDFEKLESYKINNLEENKLDTVKTNTKKGDTDEHTAVHTSKDKKENKQNLGKESKIKNKSKKSFRDDNGQNLDSPKEKRGKKAQKHELQIEQKNVPSTKETPLYGISEHSVLSWNGNYTIFRKGKGEIKQKGHNLRMAFDVINQELYLLRSDGTSSLFTPDHLTVTFPDGSRITSFVKDVTDLNIHEGSELDLQDSNQTFDSKETASSNSILGATHTISIDNSKSSEKHEKESSLNENFVFVVVDYNLEHNNYASIKFLNSDHEAELILPGNITVKIDENRLFVINANGYENITLSNDNKLLFEAPVLAHAIQQSSTLLHFENVGTKPTVVCQTVDSLGNILSIDDRGNTNLLPSNVEVNRQPSTMYTPQYAQNIQRFFVLNRDLKGYEMIYKNQIHHKRSEREIIKTPLVKGNNDIFSLISQIPLNESKSEQYLMSYIEENSFPLLIRRKDLIKEHEMPTIIWFLPEISTIIESEINERLPQPIKMPKAITTSTKLRMKTKVTKFISSFSLSLQNYMQINVDTYKKYLGYYIDEVRKEDVYANSEQYRQNLYGLKSYYLMDNLPAVIIETEYNKLLQNKSNLNIESVSSSMSQPVNIINTMF